MINISKSNSFFNHKNEFHLAKQYFNYLNKNKIEKNYLLYDNGEDKYINLAKEKYDNYKIFESNYKKIEKINKKNKSIKLELNKFADQVNFDDDDLHDDLMKINYRPNINPFSFFKRFFNNKKLPPKLIWDNKTISNVKNQGLCGSCWAFSTTNLIEANMRINNYTTVRLSEQELVDCSNENYGCDGGLMHLALDYCIESNGLTSNEQYPYVAKTNECSLSNNVTFKKVIGSNITNYEFIIPKSSYDIMKSLQNGPISMALDANTFLFRFYKEGVIDIPSHRSKDINHAVLLTGYDSDENGKYWIIQNSWGNDWGDNGYAKIRIRNGDGTLLCQLYGVYIPKV